MTIINIIAMISIILAGVDGRLPDHGRNCSYKQIKRYTIDANDVVLINTKRIKRMQDLGGLYLYKVDGKVEVSHKGMLKTGVTVIFHVEAAYEYKLNKGKTYVFLKQTLDENGSIIRRLQINDIGAIPGMCAYSPRMREVIKNLMSLKT